MEVPVRNCKSEPAEVDRLRAPKKEASRDKPALVLGSGPLSGTRYLLEDDITLVGRNPENDVVVTGPDCAIVSGHHLEIRREGNSFILRDLNSTNGTFVDGQRVTETRLEAPCVIQLGAGGPQLLFVMSAPPQVDLDRTLIATPGAREGGAGDQTEQILQHAVTRARLARSSGIADQTGVIMREVLQHVVRRTRRRWAFAIWLLVVAMAASTAYSVWRIRELKRAKAEIDVRIYDLETRLAQPGQNPEAADKLIALLNQYQNEALALQANFLYRLGVRSQEDFVRQELRLLMAEFGAEIYSLPPEFVESVNRYTKQFQGPDRPNMERALKRARPELEKMRSIFEKNNLPPDLAYMAVVESAFDHSQESGAGAAGLWQFTPATARSLGLIVDENQDERLDTVKATNAACKYIRRLILEFGTGSSVMLALAAYNLGPARVKGAIERNVRDPIKQRNFWYLYRTRALPAETREYVPKVMAAMLIGRNPARFGF
ncbi:MAG TPA: transglycosylase SLT domain-containing protein [Bryobacteraceae bacterium]|nr:transglycosylase SLT domain-containing protein [Bryobacteraceae bacterium]HPU73963.1 transglycosylase SLT domain-containing protein [Bryobacteraceae bacterium]